MVYDAATLRQELLKKFEGKDAAIWNVGYAVMAILKTLGHDTTRIFVFPDRFNVTLRYVGEAFIYIECKRKKGDTHYRSFGGSHTDYTWKDFVITFYGATDLEAAYLKAMQTVKDREQKQADDKALAYDVYRFLRDTFPGHDSRKFYKLANLISDNEHEFSTKYNEEKQS